MKTLQKEKPEYAGLKFPGEFEFMQWLSKTSRYVVHFEDEGQDLLYMYLDEGGEVLHVKLNGLSRLYNGKIVDLDSVRVGGRIVYGNHNMIKYRIEKVEVRDVGRV